MAAPVTGRQVGVLERVDHAWAIYRRHLGAFVAIGMVTDGLVLLLALLFAGSAAYYEEAISGGRPLPPFVYAQVPILWFVGPLCAAWGVASLLSYTRLAYTGQPAPVRQVLRVGLRDIWRTLLLILAIAVIPIGVSLIGAFLALLPIIRILAAPALFPFLLYVLARYSLALPAHLFERLPLRSSLQRGWDLAGTRVWHVLGFYIIVYLITFGLTLLMSLAGAPLMALVPDKTVTPIWLAVLLYLLVFAPLYITTSNWMIVSCGLLFLELRDEQEGYDIWQRLRAIEESRGFPASPSQPS